MKMTAKTAVAILKLVIPNSIVIICHYILYLHRDCISLTWYFGVSK